MPVKTKSEQILKKLLSNAWLDTLKLKFPVDCYKRILIELHKKIIPVLQNPLKLSDFLTDSYNLGKNFLSKILKIHHFHHYY